MDDKTDQRQEIEAARALLRPSEVRLHHVPQWLVRRLRPLRIRCGGRYRVYSAEAVLEEVVTTTGGRWLDHYGSTTIGDMPCFVSEPYNLTTRDVQALDRLAEATGLKWYVSANSWWYPGWTLRIVIHEPRVDGRAM